MNAQAVEWVNKNSAYKRTSGTQAVLRTIAASYGADGSCLSMRELVKRSSVSEATAHRAISKLSQDGVIRVSRNGGDARRTGYTNRYQIFGYDLPIENGRGLISNVIPRRAKKETLQDGVSQKPDSLPAPEPALSDLGTWGLIVRHTPASRKIETCLNSKAIPQPAQNETPSDSHTHASAPLEYAPAHVHAAGENALKAKASVLSKNKDRQTDSLPVVDLDTAHTREAPESPESHNQVQPEVGYVSPFSKQTTTDAPEQEALSPGSAEPPFQDEREAVETYESAVGPLTTDIRSELIGLVKHYGLLAVQVAIANVQAAGRKGRAVQYPIAYMRGMLANQQQEGKLPGGQNRSPTRKPAEPEPERKFMKFTGWEKPAPKGVAS